MFAFQITICRSTNVLVLQNKIGHMSSLFTFPAKFRSCHQYFAGVANFFVAWPIYARLSETICLMTKFLQKIWNYLSHDQIFAENMKLFVSWPNFWQKKWNHLSLDQIFAGNVKLFVSWPILGRKCKNICLMTKFWQEKQKNCCQTNLSQIEQKIWQKTNFSKIEQKISKWLIFGRKSKILVTWQKFAEKAKIKKLHWQSLHCGTFSTKQFTLVCICVEFSMAQ